MSVPWVGRFKNLKGYGQDSYCKCGEVSNSNNPPFKNRAEGLGWLATRAVKVGPYLGSEIPQSPSE